MNNKKNGGPKKGENEKEKLEEEVKKVPRDLSHIECDTCHEMGHYATSVHKRKVVKDLPMQPSKRNRKRTCFYR